MTYHVTTRLFAENLRELSVAPVIGQYLFGTFWIQVLQSGRFCEKENKNPKSLNSWQCYKRLCLIPGQLDNRCFKDFNNCQQGISISFWLQFIDGLYIVAITNANNTILSVRVKHHRNLLIQLTAGSSRYQINRSCFPVGWFFLTITWDHTSK